MTQTKGSASITGSPFSTWAGEVGVALSGEWRKLTYELVSSVGDNAKAALLTRGLAEMARFGAALGAETQTFWGLAGMGDLIVTCTSQRSRNRHVGEELGSGKTIEEIIASMNQVAEGVKAEFPDLHVVSKGGGGEGASSGFCAGTRP